MFFEDSWFLIISFILSGIGAGFIAGLFGVGGGIIMVPIFYSFFQSDNLYGYFAIQVAVATSLAVMVVTSLSSFQFHYRKGSVDMQTVKHWAIPIALGSIAGSSLATRIPAQELTIFFGVFMSFLGVKMALNKNLLQEHARAKATRLFHEHSLLRYVPPSIVGCISSMLGVGGGSMSVPILSSFGYPIVRAVGTSATFGFFIALPSVFIFGNSGEADVFGINAWHAGFIDITGFLIVGPISVLIAPVGAKVAHSLKGDMLKQIFGGVLFLVGIRMILSGLF